MSTINPYFGKKIKSAHTFLSRWSGAMAEMWEMTSHHKSLRVILRRESNSSNLVLVCLDPVWVKGPVKWMNSDLRVETTTLPESREIGFAVVDDSVGFKAICGALEVKENVKL